MLPSRAGSHKLSLMCAQTQEQRFIINAMKVEYQSVWLEGLLLCMYFRITSSAEMVFTQKAKKSNENYKSLKCIFIPHGANFEFFNYINKVSKNLGSQDSQPHGKCLNRNQNQEMVCSKISIEKYNCVGSGWGRQRKNWN